MSDESSGIGQRAKSLVEQAKQSVGAGETPLATKVGGRAEAVEEALKAFGQGDIDRFLEAFSDDVTWSGPKGENFPGAGNHDGRDAIREAFVRDVERSFASFGFRPDHFLGAPDEDIVVAVGAFTGEGVKGEGQLDAPAVQVWSFDGDEVVAVDIYTDSAAFPGVVTEQEEKEREQEQDERDDDGETDGEGKGDAEDEGDGGAESQGDGDGKRGADAKGDADGEGKRRDDDEDEDDSDDDSRGRNGG
jgi:ketosteroid isomerase-like protein